jgi:hypothetical protein
MLPIFWEVIWDHPNKQKLVASKGMIYDGQKLYIAGREADRQLNLSEWELSWLRVTKLFTRGSLLL